MLITFHSKAAAQITYFGDIATTLLKLMGQSGTLPGALLAADIPAAIIRLQQGLAASGPGQPGKHNDQPDAAGAVAASAPQLQLRAYPLLQMLAAAALQGHSITWEKGGPPV
jgi:hypothetical protein